MSFCVDEGPYGWTLLRDRVSDRNGCHLFGRRYIRTKVNLIKPSRITFCHSFRRLVCFNKCWYNSHLLKSDTWLVLLINCLIGFSTFFLLDSLGGRIFFSLHLLTNYSRELFLSHWINHLSKSLCPASHPSKAVIPPSIKCSISSFLSSPLSLLTAHDQAQLILSAKCP